MLKARKGLSSVMGSLFLIVLVFVAWTFLFRYTLFYVYVAQGNPDISLSSTVLQLNGGVNNGGVCMVEVNVKNGDLPFTLTGIVVSVNGNVVFNKNAGSVYTSFNQTPNAVSLPLSLRPNQDYTIYFFIAQQPINTQHPVVSIEGYFGSNYIEIQSSAQVMYG
ncbi:MULTISPECIES: hypothetical protein [Metallosphaera]|uniref:hypothetical protein n=1 Tax=Metallosphaera TaxID=41980 RepID=UPI001F066AEB|nr:hypothetical protein [Metallosphaera sedula]MCH1770448.1 hypothetical protein [Metallosphaera sedula]